MSEIRLSPVALIAASLALPGAAMAQSACTPSAPISGGIITCSGLGTGIVDDTLSDSMIQVAADANIQGAAQGFEFDDNVVMFNNGSITGLGDHGVQGDNDSVVMNYGRIEGMDGDGVNLDDDSRVINYGTIIGSDDGVQLEANAFVVNETTGFIYGADEGVNINVDNATLINKGRIEAGDDAVDAGENAQIVNYGTITSTGGSQDGIDLDSGQVINYGTILAIGSEDGIDFDPSVNDSLVVNDGLIEGNIAINTDPADTGAQTVVNNGTLRGRGGVAVNLGAGDDALHLSYASVVEGLIEMGDGIDTVTVSGIRARRLSFGSLPEILNYNGPGLLAGSTLLLIDPMPLAAADHLARGAAFGASGAVLDRHSMSDSFVGVFGSGTEVAADGMLQGFDSRSGGVVAGYGFGPAAAFVAFAQSSARMQDGAHRLDQTALMAGVSTERATGSAHGRIAALAYLGVTSTELRSPATLSGDADMTGALLGLGLRYSDGFGGTGAAPLVDVNAQLDIVHHRTGSYALSGLGATITDQSATALGLHLDLGMPVAVGSGTLRPYLFGNLRGGSQGALTMSLAGSSTSFAAIDVFGDSNYGIGVSYGSEALSAGVEWATNAQDERSLGAHLTFRLAF
ncbi:autotransporter outer membrane beta-barrel domain-containing protein [Pararhodobacter sp. CCB-MM2]|uniref:autotransporter outer membrane beta-barrel domain-containing protein n=1 Tax=Pararhodobacter sp. CCB-MM2 TaxID=1786003 RepID=UPI001111FC43|nr:autotransporter outer membrane beta-barrel domain-containing protein [Pararhodobacter sp. CCB-MM2]